MAMDARKQRILEAIVALYANDGEPVGSGLLANYFDMALSSATLRNEMAALTKLGLLEQPHTSAGRVPSAQGYRYYLDHLIDAPSATTLSDEDRRHIDDLFACMDAEPEKLVPAAARSLADLTGCAAAATTPQAPDLCIAHFEVVQVGRYSTTLYLKVTDGGFSYKDYSSQSQRATPYLGQDDAPTKVSKLFTAAPTGISWADAGFVQPFLNRLNTTLTFGATEYVGRRYSERSTNTGAGGRTSTNVILSTTRGELVIAPASGKIDLAEDLGGDYGITLVIDHGAGLRSIFYGLTALDVEAGDDVKQGQLLGGCSKAVVAEMRIGTVPIDPLAVWRSRCDGLKLY